MYVSSLNNPHVDTFHHVATKLNKKERRARNDADRMFAFGCEFIVAPMILMMLFPLLMMTLAIVLG
jgi:hypothetical protein